jgi:hypothetical protein
MRFYLICVLEQIGVSCPSSYHLICNKSNMTSATSETGTTTLPEHLSSLLVLMGSCRSIFSFLCSVLLIIFFLWFYLSVLRFTDFDYPLGIFKLFLIHWLFHSSVLHVGLKACTTWQKNAYIFGRLT